MINFEAVDQAAASRGDANGAMWIPVKGRSMWPSLREGDDAETTSVEDRGLRQGDVAVARVADRLVIHRVLAVREDSILLRGDNAARADPPIPKEQILGVVARVRRDGRVLETEEWKRRPGALRLLFLRFQEGLFRARSP